MNEATVLEYLGPATDNQNLERLSMSEPEDLVRAVKIVESCYSDQKLLALYDMGDALSKRQTKHDRCHAFSVRDVAISLAEEYETLFPGRLNEWTKRVVIPLAAFLHDIGRAVDVNNHAVAGAALMNDYLSRSRLPREVIRRIVRIIALHRSAQVLKLKIDDPAWAIVVIADKCVGDEDRVRDKEAAVIKILRFFGLAKHNWWQDAAHHRVNFAIKQAVLAIDSNQDLRSLGQLSKRAGDAIVLKIRLDERVAPAGEVMSLYAERFRACGRAAQYLGLVFRLEFNGIVYLYDKKSSGWIPAQKGAREIQI